MRISDWSSDVCSSDLRYGRGIGHRGVAAAVPHAADADTAPLPRILLVELLRRRAPVAPGRPQRVEAARQARRGLQHLAGRGRIADADGIERAELQRIDAELRGEEIGRASCRERVCQYV